MSTKTEFIFELAQSLALFYAILKRGDKLQEPDPKNKAQHAAWTLAQIASVGPLSGSDDEKLYSAVKGHLTAEEQLKLDEFFKYEDTTNGHKMTAERRNAFRYYIARISELDDPKKLRLGNAVTTLKAYAALSPAQMYERADKDNLLTLPQEAQKVASAFKNLRERLAALADKVEKDAADSQIVGSAEKFRDYWQKKLDDLRASRKQGGR